MWLLDNLLDKPKGGLDFCITMYESKGDDDHDNNIFDYNLQMQHFIGILLLGVLHIK